ncbi:MAG: 23S rRNA (adenine(2503)-C(2))-methyltransferase RlmN [Chloroflexi bacterium]|nr:23S rRNA (adenine(2503)-C(2))-methyltransferase RlmN [Chloroflexota bacterium]
MSKRHVYDLDLPEWEQWVQEQGQPRYRARQIWEGLYRHLWDRPEAFHPLPKALRAALAEAFTFRRLTPEQEQVSSDGETHKTLFRLPDGPVVETVRMRYLKRRTLCISTQSGCAMGCVFCATGQLGLLRNLTAGEIVEQVIYYARWLRAQGDRVTNIVVMGMGEPFHNYAATMEALDRLNHPRGFNLGARRITISTVGLVPKIRQFAREGRQYNLAVSLHAADDALRQQLIPVARRWPLAELMDTVQDYIRQTHRRVTFEWALIRDVNDTPEQAHKLKRLLRGMLAHVNLIPLNPTPGYEGRASTQRRAEAFCAILREAGIPCTIRLRRGIDIQAGCGQLAGQALGQRPRFLVGKSLRAAGATEERTA